MEQAATALGRRYQVADIVTGGLVLAVVTSLPNAVTAVYLAVRGRGAAVLSTALNSNAINVMAGLLRPGEPDRAGGAVRSGHAGDRVVRGADRARAGVRLPGRGLGRMPGAVIIAGYLAFVTALIISVTQAGVRPAAAIVPAGAVIAAGALLLTWPPRGARRAARHEPATLADGAGNRCSAAGAPAAVDAELAAVLHDRGL